MKRQIPYYSFEKINSDIREAFEEIFNAVMDSKWYILGKELESFENSFARYIRVKHAIGVGSGFDALRISLAALDLKENDEVILPSFTFIATLLAVIHSGAKPILVDVNPDTYVLDPQSLYPFINSRTKVIIPVHIYGYPCDMKEINAMANQKEIQVIEDYAQAVGSHIDGKKAGSFGFVNAASFYPTKTLGAIGDGGIITTNDEKIAHKCKTLRNYGFESKKQHKMIGYNSRLDELHAAFLSKKLQFLEKWIGERKSVALQYMEKLKDIPEIKLPDYSLDRSSAYHIFPIRSENRDQLRQYLQDQGICTLIHYEIPPHLQDSMKHLGYGEKSFPVTEEISKTQLSLPIYPGLSEDNIHFIAQKIQEFYIS
jgi:dTDP-4-amino-4,6-dideoxygalactose transaminase